MGAPFGFNNYQIAAIVAVIAIVVLLVIPASRHWLILLWMQFRGWGDARLLRKHHIDLVVGAVTRRVARIIGHTDAAFSEWLRACRAWFSTLAAAYNRALTEWEHARKRLAEEEEKALHPHAEPQPDIPQFMPLGPASYWFAQLALGLGECALTYTAFQSWHLSPVLLVVVVIGSGLLGGAFGHLCGQAIYRGNRRATFLIGMACALYCIVLGVMRFAWLTRDGEAGGATFGNFLGAFGWPLLCMAASIIVGSQLRYLTDLEQAQQDELRAKHRCGELDERGKAAQKSLRDRMRARAALKTAHIDAYHRGFIFGWLAAPVPFPDQRIVIPADIDALWPVERWAPPATSTDSAPPAQVQGNGSARRELAVR